MRFRTELKNIKTFASEFYHLRRKEREQLTHLPAELTTALSSLEKIAWLRLSDDTARFTVIPDMGSQVWAYEPLRANA